MPDYIGKYACYFTVATIKNKPTEEWLRTMKRNFERVSPYEVTDSQQKAWENEFDVLKAAIAKLPESYGRLYVVFEYVLPRHRPGTNRAKTDIGVRADAIIVGKDVAVVLEFKRKKNIFEGDVNQAKMYRTRLQDYHTGSVRMRKKAILILTKAEGFFKHLHRAEVCSPDKLSEVLLNIFGEQPMTKQDMEVWINSKFEAR